MDTTAEAALALTGALTDDIPDCMIEPGMTCVVRPMSGSSDAVEAGVAAHDWIEKGVE